MARFDLKVYGRRVDWLLVTNVAGDPYLIHLAFDTGMDHLRREVIDQ